MTAANYTFTFVNGTLTVNKAVLTVTANDAAMTYGGTLPAFSAKYSGFVNSDLDTVVTGTPSFTPTTAPTAAGISPITPAQGSLAAANYTFTFVNGTLTVNKAVLTVTANDASMTYGGTLPSFSAKYSGFVNSDPETVVTGTPSFTPTTAPTSAGTSPITPAQGSLTAANYTFTFVNGTLTVNKAVLTVKADDQSKVYGAVLPALTGTLTGVVNADGVTATYGTAATTASPVGTYPITVNLIDPNSKLSNYDVTTTSGTLTISKASLTVMADDATRQYGDANPTFTASFSGFKNGETVATSGVTGTPSLTTTATPASATTGKYVITTALGGLVAANYDFTFVNGTLTITARPVTVTADAKAKLYGAADPALTYQITSGSLVSGDGFSGVLARDAGENVGSYTINQGTLAVNTNYTITYVGAKLTIGYGSCVAMYGSKGVLPPINKDGSSVFQRKGGSTIPVKFRVCDYRGASISDASVVFASLGSEMSLVGTAVGLLSTVNEDSAASISDTSFRWDSSSQQWILNLSTNPYQAGYTYKFLINLRNGNNMSWIVGLK